METQVPPDERDGSAAHTPQDVTVTVERLDEPDMSIDNGEWLETAKRLGYVSL